jgi:NAD(P)-dependent dehydrogenase (short-subunit alcohol dehydrogenase family)
MPGLAAYSASKIGVEHFASSFRLEVAHKGVAVGTAHPCWIWTDLVRDLEHDLDAFEKMRKKLPGPFGSTTTVGECAAALVGAIERRRRKVFIPRTLAPFAAVRQFFSSPMSEKVLIAQARKSVPELEREVRAVGRSFGAHSVEVVERDNARGDEPATA